MCLIAFANGAHPACPLLLARNRDEFFDRPTDPLHRWTDGSGIWAGRDRREGGTWLGLNERGRVAWLTNVRSAHNGPGQRSRGELATRWLQSDTPADVFAQGLDPQAYAGFNLVLGDLRRPQWTWLSNRHPAAPHDAEPAALHRQALAPGLYGLSNAALDTPWPKTLRLKAALAQALAVADDEAQWHTPLRLALADDQTVPEAALPRTGVAADWERALSSPFVRSPANGYGTRSSLLMRVLPQGDGYRADLQTWAHSPAGWQAGEPARHQVRC
jgi:uncharacterized protein with NRDE domain